MVRVLRRSHAWAVWPWVGHFPSLVGTGACQQVACTQWVLSEHPEASYSVAQMTLGRESGMLLTRFD